jgi:tetratricopeptide (TPR) repeat protein
VGDWILECPDRLQLFHRDKQTSLFEQELADRCDAICVDYYAIGELDLGIKVYPKLILFLDPIHTQRPDLIGIAETLANICGSLGNSQQQRNRLEEGEASYQQAIAILEPIHTRHPDLIGIAETLANICGNYGVLARSQGKALLGVQQVQKALSVLRPYRLALPRYSAEWIRFQEIEQLCLTALHPGLPETQSGFALFFQSELLSFLLRWNSNWEAYHLIGGKFAPEQDHNLRDTAIREVCEEIQLKYDQDYTLGDEKNVELIQYSRSQKLYKRYRFGIFVARLLLSRDEITARLSTFPNDELRWCTLEEIHQEKTADGRPISPTAFDVIVRVMLS